MRIGIVCYPTYGGSGVVATELGLGMAKKGHQVHFISYSQPARLEAELFPENVSYHEVGISRYPLFQYPPYELALTSRIVSVANYENLDLLHVHYAIPHASAAVMARQILKDQGRHLPIITTLHGTDITLVGKDPSYAPVVTYAINASNAVTAVSESLRQDTLEHFDIRRKIEVIPNFVDLTRFGKRDVDHFKKAICPNGEKMLVHTSNFRKVKRIDLIIRAFQKIREQVPSKLLLVGDGPEREKMEALCRELGVCDDIRFLGKLSSVADVLSVADLFLMASEQESFGLAALEAMACEVPVVCTDAGGQPELVEHEVSGMIFPVGDVEALTRGALHILSTENLPRFRTAAKARAKLFDLPAILPVYEQLYERVVSESTVPLPLTS